MLTRRLVLTALAAVLALGVNQAAQASEEAAASHVEQLAARSIAALKQTDLADSARRAILAETLDQALDIPLISRAVLGKAGREADAATRERFEAVFAAYLTDSIARKLEGQADGTLMLVATTPKSNAEVLVDSYLVSADGRKIRAVWRVRVADQGPKIVDVAVEGISLVLTQRQEFAAVIKRQGLEGLVALLHGKVQTAAAR